MAGSSRRFKDTVYDQFARIGKAISNPRRLELLDLLTQSPHAVEALAAQIDQSVANTSHHLQVLRAARLVENEKAGTRVIYRIAGDDVTALLQIVRGVAESHLAEVEQVARQFFEEREAMEPLDSAGLAERMQAGEVTLIDVRPAGEYEAGHIPGAVSVPLTQLEDRIGELPNDREVVAYCRGPYCVLAIEAVGVLRSRGFEAVRMEDGVNEWVAHGQEVETEKAGI